MRVCVIQCYRSFEDEVQSGRPLNHPNWSEVRLTTGRPVLQAYVDVCLVTSS